MLERIYKAFASVRAFTGNASHELRTPISLLRTEIEVALFRSREGEEYRATLSHLHQETIRMTNLVENLLSLARADGGVETLTLVPIELNGVFERIEQTWKQAMQLAQIRFRIEIHADNLFVLGDPASIARLLSILLENACKFTQPAGIVVLKASVLGEKVLLSVYDTGIGIPAGDIPKIFDRFYRGTQTDAQISRGSGLGLALGKWIAEQHGTELAVENNLGEGSCFSFLLECTTAAVPR
jgi:signal transduction histidine kinase